MINASIMSAKTIAYLIAAREQEILHSCVRRMHCLMYNQRITELWLKKLYLTSCRKITASIRTIPVNG